MANFRVERMFVMLDEPVRGLNHLRAVDPVELAMLGSDSHADSLGLTPLSSFEFAPFDRPRWFPANEGLKTVRGLIDLYEKWLSSGTNEYGYASDVLASWVATLRQLEDVLDQADTFDRRFYFAVKDLA